MAKNLLDVLGLGTYAEKFAYAHDDRFGLMAREKIPQTWVKTTCGYCSVGCGMLIGVRDGAAVSVKGDPDHPVNDGKLCPKGLCEHEAIHAKGRALYPVRRSWSGFKRISWNEAFGLFVSKVRDIQEKYGKDRFAILSTGQLVTEEFYTLGKLAQLGIRTRNYDGNTTLCMASAVAGYKRSFGSDGPPGCYEDFDTADVVMLIGANIADNHPILAYRLFKNKDRPNGAKVIVVDPRATKTAMLAIRNKTTRQRFSMAREKQRRQRPQGDAMKHSSIEERLPLPDAPTPTACGPATENAPCHSSTSPIGLRLSNTQYANQIASIWGLCVSFDQDSW